MATIGKNPPTSYKWSDEDRALIEALRKHYAGPDGEPASATAVHRTALRALAEREGVVYKRTKINRKKSGESIDE